MLFQVNISSLYDTLSLWSQGTHDAVSLLSQNAVECTSNCATLLQAQLCTGVMSISVLVSHNSLIHGVVCCIPRLVQMGSAGVVRYAFGGCHHLSGSSLHLWDGSIPPN